MDSDSAINDIENQSMYKEEANNFVEARVSI